MQVLTAGLALTAAPLGAEAITCVMADGSDLQFVIHDSQFAPALDPREPPRQARSIVTHGPTQFPAAPFRLGPVRGFEAEGPGGTTTLFVIQPDGSATLTNAQDGDSIIGTCTATKDAQ